jgi:hypothetical protein
VTFRAFSTVIKAMKRIIPTILVLAVLFGLVRLFRVVQKFDPTAQHNVGSGLPDVSIRFEGAEIVSRHAGVPDWTVQADRIDLRRTDYGGLDNYSSADFIGVHNGVFYRDGKKEAFFKAKNASYDPQKQHFIINGGIHLTSMKGDTLASEQCLWSEREDTVRLERGMNGVIDGHKINAPYVLFSPKKRVVNCPQGAEALFDGYPLHASNLLWDVNSGHVHCLGPVSGKRKSMSFTAANADIYLDTKRGLVADKSKNPGYARLHVNKSTIHLRIEGDGESLGGLQ